MENSCLSQHKVQPNPLQDASIGNKMQQNRTVQIKPCVPNLPIHKSIEDKMVPLKTQESSVPDALEYSPTEDRGDQCRTVEFEHSNQDRPGQWESLEETDPDLNRLTQRKPEELRHSESNDSYEQHHAKPGH